MTPPKKRKRIPNSMLGLSIDTGRLEGVVIRRSNGSLQTRHTISSKRTSTRKPTVCDFPASTNRRSSSKSPRNAPNGRAQSTAAKRIRFYSPPCTAPCRSIPSACTMACSASASFPSARRKANGPRAISANSSGQIRAAACFRCSSSAVASHSPRCARGGSARRISPSSARRAAPENRAATPRRRQGPASHRARVPVRPHPR